MKHKMVGVPVNNQRGNSVGFAVDQPVRVGLFYYGLTIVKSPGDPIFPEICVNGFLTSGNEAESDLRMFAVKTLG